MNNKVGGVIICMFALVGTMAYVAYDQQQQVAANEEVTLVLNSDEKEQVADVKAVETNTNYIPYNEELFAQAYGEGYKTALFFKSNTCGSCAYLDIDILDNVKNIPDDVVIFTVDWESDLGQDLAVQYEVTRFHTITYVDDQGQLIKNQQGVFTLDEVVEGFTQQ